VYERFTDDARMTMVLAFREAQGRHQDHVGTEHVLLGLIDQPDCAAARILMSLDVSLQGLRLEVEKNTSSSPDAATTGEPPTPLAKRAIEYAIEEARGLGHDRLDTGHLLLGLVRDPDGVAGRALRGEGLVVEVVRQKLTEHYTGL
jgi:ATP-dependent Clp protease ATP-binding subunit ClpC